MRFSLMKSLLEVSTSGEFCSCAPAAALLQQRSCSCLTAVMFLRSTSCRAYRLPPCALINLCHGSRADRASHRLTAVVKPQPAAAGGVHAQRQLGSLNHSPRSPFTPTQVRPEAEAPLPSLLRENRSD